MSSSSDAVIYIVDDDAAVRDSLAVLLSTVDLPAETFASGQDFLDAWSPMQRGCLVLDIRMPGISGLELLEILATRKARLPVIIMTAHGDVKIAVKAMKLGAADFIEKPFKYEVMIESIKNALQRNEEERSTELSVAAFLERLTLLTEREREIFNQMVQGDPNKVIAAKLDISPRTVEIHRSHVMEKLQVKNLSQLVKMSILAHVG